MDLVIDAFFTADIVVNFRTAWIDTGGDGDGDGGDGGGGGNGDGLLPH